MIHTNKDGFIESIEINNQNILFDGQGPKVFGCNDIQHSLSWHMEDNALIIHFSAKNTSSEDIYIDRMGIYLGVNCYMEKFPDWNDRMFPTLLRCEKTHFYGYFMNPNRDMLGIACKSPIASYKLLYNQLPGNNFGHRIYSVELDILNSAKQPSRHPQNLNCIRKGEVIKREFVLFTANSFDDYVKSAEKYTEASIIFCDKYTVELNEAITVTHPVGTSVKIISPSGKELGNHSKAEEYGVYTIQAEKNGKVTEGKVYCRKDWSYYLLKARENAISMPQKATTHCESWYGLFSGYLAAKHYPNTEQDIEIEKKFQEIMPYMFDFEKGEPLVIPQRIQNTATAISLLVDRYEANKDKNTDSLDYADKMADFLISVQHADGAYYRNGTAHYTCVIYIAKSMLELYLAERGLPQYQSRAKKHFNSAKSAIDNLVYLLDDIGTEGEQTFEDGMISCSALQIAMFALLLDESERKPYTDAAEYMIQKHECLEQTFVPDCRINGCSLRYWEAQYDILTKPNMINSPHGWTAWTLYAKYYLYLLTGKSKYLKELMNGMGACVQLIGEDGVLRWGFICDPCVKASVFVPDNSDDKTSDTYPGKFDERIIGEEYMPMISGWFKHGKQKVTGGFLKCPLFLKDKTVKVSNQGGCCDNDVHEIFKCMEETVLKKAFIHETENGEYLCYSCHLNGNTIEIDSDVETVVYNITHDTKISKAENTITLKGNNNTNLLSVK